MKRRWRRLWLAVLALPILLVLGGAAYWQFTERQLDAGFAAWVAERRSAGWDVAAGTPVHGGWPLAASLSLPDLSIKGGEPDIPGGITWKVERVVLRVGLLRPFTLDVALHGAQRLRVGDGPEVPFTADRMNLTMPLQDSTVRVDGTASNLRAGVPTGPDTTSGVTIASIRLHADAHPNAQASEPALNFSLTADTITPPPGQARTLGPRIASFSADGALDGPLPRARTLAERAAAWRDGGGTLELQHLVLNWGPLDLTVAATLSLDDQLQPMGAGSARIIGYAETLDALASHGLMSRSAATAAKAVLSLLAHAPEDGSAPDVEVPLTLQYRTLSMRQVPLVRLPELDWP